MYINDFRVKYGIELDWNLLKAARKWKSSKKAGKQQGHYDNMEDLAMRKLSFAQMADHYGWLARGWTAEIDFLGDDWDDDEDSAYLIIWLVTPEGNRYPYVQYSCNPGVPWWEVM
jgi:hypothetical protein